jgi:Major Facilitator Superfamily
MIMGANEKNNIRNNKLTSTASASPIKIPSYAWKVLAVLSLVATMVMYAETMLIPAIPDLIKDFGTSYSMSSWILTAYLVSGAVMTPIAGKLSDIYGKKRILLIAQLRKAKSSKELRPGFMPTSRIFRLLLQHYRKKSGNSRVRPR